MKVAFRADASIQIGTGHVMRCLTLADELTRQGHECWFVCREHKGHLGDLIASKGYGLTLLPAGAAYELIPESNGLDNYAMWLGVSWQDDARQTLEAITHSKPDWLVVDHYALDAKWERVVAGAVGDIMVIDDLANRTHECRLLLDQNLGRLDSDYDGLLPADCQRLIGPSYALLRPEFAARRKRSLDRRQHPELKRILISFGGVDRTNATGQILVVLAASGLRADTELDIIMGPTAPFLEEVRQQAAGLPFNASISVSVADMAERMCLADLAIGAVGSTSWERCCLGLPSILLVLAENQRSASEAIKRTGAAIIAGGPEGVRAELILLSRSSSYRDQQLAKMMRASSDMVYGDGSTIVLNELIGMAGGK